VVRQDTVTIHDQLVVAFGSIVFTPDNLPVDIFVPFALLGVPHQGFVFGYGIKVSF
jgi:hypothetical protein